MEKRCWAVLLVQVHRKQLSGRSTKMFEGSEVVDWDEAVMPFGEQEKVSGQQCLSLLLQAGNAWSLLKL